MTKKFILILVVILIIIAGATFYFLYKQGFQQGNVNNTTNCADCGEGGWQKMDEKCGQQIITKNDFKGCLMNFSWSSVNQNTSTDEIKDGYIEIGGSEVLKNPTTKSIKVFIYHQWAIDKDGNLYLLGQLG